MARIKQSPVSAKKYPDTHAINVPLMNGNKNAKSTLVQPFFKKSPNFFPLEIPIFNKKIDKNPLFLLADFLNQNQGVVLILDVTNKNDVVKALDTNQMDLVLVSKLPQ
jgi:hypothetical protein